MIIPTLKFPGVKNKTHLNLPTWLYYKNKTQPRTEKKNKTNERWII